MSKPVATVAADANLREVASLMAERDIGMLPVVREGRLAGAVTDRDICIKAVARGLPPESTAVSEAMTEDVVTCDVGRDLREAANLMAAARIRRLVVVEGRSPVGVVSLGDLSHASDDAKLVSKTLERVS